MGGGAGTHDSEDAIRAARAWCEAAQPFLDIPDPPDGVADMKLMVVPGEPWGEDGTWFGANAWLAWTAWIGEKKYGSMVWVFGPELPDAEAVALEFCRTIAVDQMKEAREIVWH